MFCLSNDDTLGVKLRTALSWAFEEERYGLTVTVPAGVNMTFSEVLESVVVISIASGGGGVKVVVGIEGGGVVGPREDALYCLAAAVRIE